MTNNLGSLTASAAIVVLALNGCASMISDNDSNVYISTEPEVASCNITGDDFERNIRTPISLSLPADAAPVTVACGAEGYHTTTGKLDTEADGWIAANVALGLLFLPLAPVAFGIDAARGAGMKYPASINIALDPSEFPSEAGRDEWYDARKAAAEEKWDALKTELNEKCQSDTVVTGCDKKLEDLEAQKQEVLTVIEGRRISSVIIDSPVSAEDAAIRAEVDER